MSSQDLVFDVDTAGFQQQVLDASRDTPVLVDFWAGWCGPCRALGPVLDALATEFQGRFRLAKVDTDANRELAMANGIRSLPTVRLFVDGKVVAEFMGAQPKSAVQSFLEEHLPPRSAGALDAVAALLDAGSLEAAREALEALSESLRESSAGRALEARLAFLGTAQDAPSEESLEQRLADDEADLDARFLLASRYAAAGRFDAAVEAFFTVLSRDRGFRDDGARRALLQVFTALGPEDPRVLTYRGRLASLLH